MRNGFATLRQARHKQEGRQAPDLPPLWGINGLLPEMTAVLKAYVMGLRYPAGHGAAYSICGKTALTRQKFDQPVQNLPPFTEEKQLPG